MSGELLLKSHMMPNTKKPFKPAPRRFHPKGITVLFEDHDILVVDKSSGLLTVSTEQEKEHTAYFLLNEYVKKGNQKSKNRIFIVHRLDRDTSGVLVFAKHAAAKVYLQEEWKNFEKTYHAVVHGAMSESEGLITSYLTENSIHRMYSVKSEAKGKLAQTRYRVIKATDHYSLLEIGLLTGRKNQIRVHLAEAGCPVVGDKVYGEKGTDRGAKRLMLHASSITFNHPHSKERMTFTAPLPPIMSHLVKIKPEGSAAGTPRRAGS